MTFLAPLNGSNSTTFASYSGASINPKNVDDVSFNFTLRSSSCRRSVKQFVFCIVQFSSLLSINDI